MIDSVFRTDKKFYPQVFLGEYIYVVREKKIATYIIADVKSSSDSDKENSDEEKIDKKSSDKEN